MSGNRETILVIDDDQLFREQLQNALEDLDCQVHACCDLESAQADLTSGFNPSLIFADRQIRGEPIETRLLDHIRQSNPGSRVVIYTRIDELHAAQVSALLAMGAVRVLDRSEMADSVENILRECTELRQLSAALDELLRGRSDLVTALVGSDVGVTVIDRKYNCWFANNKHHDLVGGRCMGGLCWCLFHAQPAECGPCWGCGIRDVLDEAFSRGTTIRRIILTHLRDGTVRWLSVETKPIRSSDGRVIAGAEAVSNLDDDFVRNMDPTERLFCVARGLIHAGFGRVRIYERQPESETLKLMAAAARTDVFETRAYFDGLRHLSLEYTKCPYATSAVASEAGILVDSWDRGDSPFRAGLDLRPPYFLVPMQDGEGKRVIGLLAADFGGWDEEREPIAIRHLARQENLRWIRNGYANEARRTLAGMKAGTEVVSREFFSRQLAALRARQRIAAASSLDEAIAALRDGFATVAPDCEFCVRCRKGNNLVAEPRLVVPEGLDEQRVVAIDEPRSLAAYVLTTHLRPLWIHDYVAYREGRGEFVGPPGMSKNTILSVAHLPLRFETTIYGVLSVDSPNLHSWMHEGFVGPLIDLAENAALVLRDIAIRNAFEEAERYRVEAQVLELQMIANVAEYLPLCIFVKNVQHVFLYVNKRFCEDVGKAFTEIVGKTDIDLFGPEIAAVYQKADDLVMSTGNTFEDDHERHIDANGKPREVHVVKTPHRSASGDIEGVVGVYWDVTETNRWFRQVKSWHDGFVQSANAIVYAHDMTGTITFANQAATASLGYGTEELMGSSVYDLVLPKDRAAVRAAIHSGSVGRGLHPRVIHEFGVVAKDGRVLNFEVATSICEFDDGKQGVLGVAHDVTERNEARAQLAHELERVKALRSIASGLGRAGEVSTLHRLFMLAVTHGECLGFSRAILFLPAGDDGRFVAGLAVGPSNWAAAQRQWQEAKYVSFEAAVQKCLGSAPAATRPGDLQSEVGGLLIDLSVETEVARDLERGKPVVRRLKQPSPIRNPQFAAAIKPDRDEDLEFVLAPLREQGELKAILWADQAFLGKPKIEEATVQHFDILWTETSLMAEALHNRAEAERVAHDIARGMSYSLLTRSGILEFELSGLRWDLGVEHSDAIKKMADAIEFFKHASVLATKDIRFAEMGVEQLVRLDVGRVLADVVGHRQNGRISLQACPASLVVQMNRTHLEDIVVELLSNALDFAKDRVSIAISGEGEFARLDFMDDGPGIHPSLRPDLFKRFRRFPEGRMGMGLAYSKSLVEAYKGRIEEIGAPGEGAHFVVRIPLQENAVHDSGT